MDVSKPIIFYDIASRPPARTYAPNPWKTRYALNFKGVHYQTEWVDLPEVENVRKKLGSEPVRTHWDGSSFYTLPVIKNTSTGQLIGDSFDIALYLDKTYPNGPSLFPPSTIGLQKAFNAHVDAIFTSHVILCVHGIPFNPETVEVSKATFLWRAGKERWEDLTVEGEERAKTLESLKTALGGLAKSYSHGGGPFLEGENPSYADLIVGGWLAFFKITVKEWEDIQTWHDGLWGKIHLALEKYAEVK
ncbi:glutathione s-transferase [Moniliophthora roreri MCA 2997]|uniref:Glutathione s-transferase n=2 Tax=Moniliophthora roreri TaxID=221103 RepID=V2X907_MONRO|nr:glutathione s-transferase [Moniliophthora roreri MCA 2997]KAI3621225.1 glutathione s-transferase [Moniliophthora roreri]